MDPVCELDCVRVRRGDAVVLDEITLSIPTGTKMGVVGSTGAGKSTLLGVLAGTIVPSGGAARRLAGATVGLLPQEPVLDDSTTVLANVRAGVGEAIALRARYDAITERLAENYSEELANEMSLLREQLDIGAGWDLDTQSQLAMQGLRCPPPETAVRDLSHGERRRVALCRLLLARPHLLLLDEPTNYLDAECAQWLERHLATYLGAVVAVTHDRYFLDNIAHFILELDGGKAQVHEGNYALYLRTKAAGIRVEDPRDAKQLRRLTRELDWAGTGAMARRADGMARLHRYEAMALDVLGIRRLDFDEVRIPPGRRLGQLVMEARHISKSIGGRQLFDDVSFSLPRNGIVGVIGPDGVGKTMLLQMISGKQKPDAGYIRVGDTVRIGYTDEDHADLYPEGNAREIICGGDDFLQIGSVEIRAQPYLAAFGFTGFDQRKPARLFSSSERIRLKLAMTIKQGGNLLLLDDPTDDLDIETLASLECAIADFPGCAVIATNDRWLLDRLASHILAWEGTEVSPGQWRWFKGNFAYYEQNKLRRLGSAADQTQAPRMAYRKTGRG